MKKQLRHGWWILPSVLIGIGVCALVAIVPILMQISTGAAFLLVVMFVVTTIGGLLAVLMDVR